jgi:hypothetical protein
MGRIVPEYGEEPLRELIVGNYRVLYGQEHEGVAVLAIVHGSRDLLQVFSEES